MVDERPTPEVEGSVEVDLTERRHQPFTLTPMATSDVETVNAEDFGLAPGRLRKLNILMSVGIHDELLRTMELSDRIEEGGFLLGRVRRATRDGGDAHLVEVTARDARPPVRRGAHPLHLHRRIIPRRSAAHRKARRERRTRRLVPHAPVPASAG